MQALVATSRSISQDRFLERDTKRKYQQHIRKVDDISHNKQHPVLDKLKQQEKMAKTLYKSKSSAKKFGSQENNTEIKRQNRLLLEKIWKMSSSIKCDNSKEQQQLQHVSGSNWCLKKKQASLIKEQNKRIAGNIINTRMEVKDYKKKMTNEIKQYLQLRDQIRKFKVDQGSKRKDSKHSKNRINSERRITLKLNDDENIQKEESEIQLITSRKPAKILTSSNPQTLKIKPNSTDQSNKADNQKLNKTTTAKKNQSFTIPKKEENKKDSNDKNTDKHNDKNNEKNTDKHLK